MVVVSRRDKYLCSFLFGSDFFFSVCSALGIQNRRKVFCAIGLAKSMSDCFLGYISVDIFKEPGSTYREARLNAQDALDCT